MVGQDRRRIVGTALALLGSALVGWWVLRTPAASSSRAAPPTTSYPPAVSVSTAATLGEITVQAAGSVRRPGVYRVRVPARAVDVVQAAGGATTDGDLDGVELAAPVHDGDRVVVPKIGALPSPTSKHAPATGPVDLNRASAAELDRLPGVGPATAQAIVTYRDRHGPFAAVDGLRNVPGVTAAKLSRWRDLLRV
jgi:competence protein ComEA